MKLSIAIAYIAASTSAPSISTSGVAASRSVSTAAKKQGVECAFEDRIAIWKSADVEELSCGVGKVCVEDSTSTMGGRCKVLVSADDEATALEPQRERGLCEKCEGKFACYGVDQSKISCGSCLGIMACFNLASDVTIGANSCIYDQACSEAEGELNTVLLDSNQICQ